LQAAQFRNKERLNTKKEEQSDAERKKRSSMPTERRTVRYEKEKTEQGETLLLMF
jgi:hypothetical protein